MIYILVLLVVRSYYLDFGLLALLLCLDWLTCLLLWVICGLCPLTCLWDVCCFEMFVLTCYGCWVVLVLSVWWLFVTVLNVLLLDCVALHG